MTEFIQILIGGLIVGSTYALIALGFSLVYRVNSVINLAQGGFCLLGALTAYSLTATLRWPVVVAVPVAVATTTIFGIILGVAAFVPGLKRLSNANMLMLTAGLLTLIEGLLMVLWGNSPYAMQPFTGDRPLNITGLLIPTQSFWVIGTTTGIVVALWYLLTRTTLGQALRACAENPVAARLMGINVSNMALFSFGLAAAIGAAAGAVIAPTTSLQFDTGRLFTIFGFIAVAIGGIGSFPGAIAGGLLLGVMSQLATAYVSSLFSNAISLGLLLVVLVLKPNGLIGGGIVRRPDVRDEARIWKHVTRLSSNTIWLTRASALVIALGAPLLFPSAGILSGLVIAGILFIALIGLDVLMGYAGQISLGQAGFMAIGGYTAAYLATDYDLPPLLGVLAGMLLSLVFALMLSAITLRLRGLYLALATLTFGLLVDSCVVGFQDVTGGPSGKVGIPSLSIGSFEFDNPLSMYYLVVAINVALLLALGGAMGSGYGRALQAIRTDPTAAAALGINVVRCKIVAFALSAVLASLSGSLYAYFFHFLSPDMVGTSRSLELVAMLIIGGEGTLIGPIFGSVLLTLLPTVFQPLAVYKIAFSGALLVICFLYMPQGLYGVIAKTLSRWTRSPSPAMQRPT